MTPLPTRLALARFSLPFSSGRSRLIRRIATIAAPPLVPLPGCDGRRVGRRASSAGVVETRGLLPAHLGRRSQPLPPSPPSAPSSSSPSPPSFPWRRLPPPTIVRGGGRRRRPSGRMSQNDASNLFFNFFSGSLTLGENGDGFSRLESVWLMRLD